MASADRPTATARASMNSRPTSRSGTPWAAARSSLTELSSSGRYTAAMIASDSTLKPMTTGMVGLFTVKMDPNRMWRVAPEWADSVVSRWRNSAASPTDAPSTMPVARSRPRTRRMPIRSMTTAPTTPAPTKPSTGLAPTRRAPEPPAVDTSVRAWPPNDWPRSTVNTPTTADTTATTAPMTVATWTGWLAKNPGSKTQV